MKFFSLLLCGALFLEAYTLDELVTLAHKNRVVEAASLSLQAKQKAYESTKSGYLPSLNLTGSYLNTHTETPISPRNALRGNLNLKYTLYDGGMREALYEKLLYSVDASKENLEATKNTLALDVTRLYFEYHSLAARKKSVDQEIKQLQAEFLRLQMFYETGSVTRDEVDKIDSRLKTQKVLLSEIEIEKQRVLHTLEYYTDVQILTLDSGAVLKATSSQEFETRPDVKLLALQTDAMLYDAEAAKSQNYPSINFENTYTHSEFFFADKANESPFFVNNQNVASLNVAWNIFDFGAINAAYESKQYEYLSQKATLEFEKNKASVEQRLAQKELELMEMKLTATQVAFDAASQTYELIKIKYQNGAIDNVAYLQALSEKQNAFYTQEKAKNDVEIKKAELLYYSGKKIWAFL